MVQNFLKEKLDVECKNVLQSRISEKVITRQGNEVEKRESKKNRLKKETFL